MTGREVAATAGRADGRLDQTPAVVLAADRLVAGYRGHPDVLLDASLAIRQGVRLAILGANGSGKTTLLRCLSGAHRPDRGLVLRDGSPIGYRRKELLAHRLAVQLVHQDPDDQLFSADVQQDISFGPMNLGLAVPQVRERVDEALELLAITDLADRPTHQLSFGQRKRVAIAGAVALRPAVLLLDEPTAGLDPQGVQSMHEAMASLERAGTTVVLSTHDVDLAWSWADEVAVVGSGSIRQGSARRMLGDAGLAAGTGLRQPWQVRMLGELGIALSAEEMPRTVEEVAGILRGRFDSSAGG